MYKRNVFLSIAKSNKLVLFTVMLFLLIALPSLFVFDQKIRGDIYHASHIELKRELENKTVAIKKHFQDSVTAIRFLDATPPIKGITRATENNRVDPLLGTPMAIWQERLASIFSGFMRTDESILQARYIALAEGGQEIVRVDRNYQSEIKRVQGSQLQKKGQRDYIIKASMLDENTVYISPINYNRENGDIQKPYVSTFRVAKPVFDKDKQVFAVLVTNYFADQLFKSLEFELPKNTAIYLMNSENEFLFHPNPDLSFGFEFNRGKTWSDEFKKAQSMTLEGVIPLNNLPKKYFIKKRIYFDGNIAMLPLELAVSVDSDMLMTQVNERRENFIALLAIFLIVLLVVTIVYQRFINRKLLIHSLKEQNNKVIENSLDAIFTIKSTGIIVHCNNTAKHAFSNAIENEVDFVSMFTLADIDKDCLSQTINAGSKMPFEAIYTEPNGNKQYYSITLTSVFDVYENAYQVAAILRNISSLKCTQSALESLNNTLELKVSQRTLELECAIDQALIASQAKSDFVANISHEIRTPMNGVLGMLEMLKEGSLSEQQHHYLKLANSSAHSLMNLINDILDFSKIEAGKLDIDNHTFDIVTVCSDMISSLALQGQRKGLEVFLDTKDVVDRMVIGDSHRLKQILINLVNNAFKFTHRGEVSLTVGSKYITDSKLLMSFTVKDTGIGIAAENIAKLFDMFTQEDSSTTRHFGGTGLGLSISKKLAQLMGGNISVISEKGVGSTFCATIELHVAQDKKLNTGIELATNVRIATLIAHDSVYKNVCDLLQNTCKIHSTNIERLDYFSEYEEFEADLLIIDDEHLQINALIRFCEQYDKKYVLILRDMVADSPAKAVLSKGSHILNKPLTQDQFSYKLASLFGSDNELIITPSKELIDECIEPDLSPCHILLVDDNMINIEVAKAILKPTKVRVTSASDGLEALEILKQNKEHVFDVILMDCQMPNLNGYDTTNAIRNSKAGSNYANVPIIAMTASAMEGDRQRCLAAGMNDYITKPIKPHTLKSKLLTWLN
ncbi:hybrid sensor histidine kinase/response regulator [Pseudoalteromonas aliena]|uniref:Sensory/regulatory protein RpfC n=1 Tax=Pseudoalteromonas aliena TaxID=247523 RepID=A0A1Q2H1E5_9GAMM|nr:response regulator [Pseudoalteromonas aliena]AQQ01180.1 hybrid sensor histidine kinase/response regulator [Pseudoalteromonas aliena]